MSSDGAGDFSIRVMTRANLDLALDWAASEGWNPGLRDAECFYGVDPEGFLMGFLDDIPVACISAVAWDANFGFIGLYIVRPGYRGRGFGLAVWKRAMERLAGRTIGLDGVAEQQENYRTSGFCLAYANIRYSGEVVAARGLLEAESGTEPLDDSSILGAVLRDCRDIGIDSIAEFDRSCFPAMRRRFVSDWISRPGTIARALVSTRRRDTRPDSSGAPPAPGGFSDILGYGVLRPCREGWKAGPLYAVNTAAAKAILKALLECAGEGVWNLDVPEPNASAVALAEELGLRRVFGTARMYSGIAPSSTIVRIYGVTSFELG